ncbi:hypothetical protein PBRA_006582 [Plasmodiophora brassicae]|uniref:Uncharacterized protein n=1 Tax=Plasmodiophora brassicae TaxID=37360 RepID=A0A0G4ISY7_PLABS|nr:hypothetical protein PBRA_006582 [Plasmodiophora brassicae]
MHCELRRLATCFLVRHQHDLVDAHDRHLNGGVQRVNCCCRMRPRSSSGNDHPDHGRRRVRLRRSVTTLYLLLRQRRQPFMDLNACVHRRLVQPRANDGPEAVVRLRVHDVVDNGGDCNWTRLAKLGVVWSTMTGPVRKKRVAMASVSVRLKAALSVTAVYPCKYGCVSTMNGTTSET